MTTAIFSILVVQINSVIYTQLDNWKGCCNEIVLVHFKLEAGTLLQNDFGVGPDTFRDLSSRQMLGGAVRLTWPHT